MTVAETLLLDFDPQIVNTRRTLERVPVEQSGWTHHAKSMPMGRLAMHCATLPRFGLAILADDGMDLAAPKRPFGPLVFNTTEETLEQLDSSAAELREFLAASNDDRLAAPWRFSWGDRVISEVSRALTYRQMFFNHLVHHTAQLGVYLRHLDLPVPGLYGPSADEPWTP